MYTLRVRDHFDAAHYLPWHEGKCKELHGHRWEVEIILESDTRTKDGIVVDFDIVKNVLRDVLPDHCYLNDWLSNPTAENIARNLFRDLVGKLTFRGVRFKEVTVWESPNCSVTYRPEET